MNTKEEDSLWNEKKPVKLVSKSIWEATKKGLLHEVNYWLNKEPSTMFVGHNMYYETPLYIAASDGNFKIVYFLITKTISQYAKEYDLWKPLKWIFSNKPNDLYNLQNKLQTGARMYYKSKDDHAKFQMPLLGAALNGHLKIVQYLLTNGYKINDYGIEGKTALHFASLRGHVDLVAYLLKNGAEVNCEDIAGRTPLFYATALRDPAITKYLIESGADVNHFDENELTPFHRAARNLNVENVKLLIENGAVVYINYTRTKITDPLLAIQRYIHYVEVRRSSSSSSSTSIFDTNIMDSDGEINHEFER